MRTHDGFSKQALFLRKYFETVFADPRRSHPQRFCWDYWHIPGEYTLLRTPAYHFFPQNIYESFHRQLVRWGRENLGCHDISPPWLSCYVDGCRQEEHQDVPHGPLAFVYSLTPWNRRKFSGGETFLRVGKKQKLVAPQFNRLTVFDPATPHGVRLVKGIHTPVEGRLVIHGWFVQPRPFFVGKLKQSQIDRVLDDQLAQVLNNQYAPGFASLRLQISKMGTVQQVTTLVDTTGSIGAVKRGVAQLKFPRAAGATRLTLPLMFSL